MDVQAPMAKRLRIICRILAAVTLLEGLVGLYGVALNLSLVPLALEFMQQRERPYVHSTFLMFLMAAIDLSFVVLLFVGAFLWKLQRRGLSLLVCTLFAEIVYFIGALFLSIHLDRPHSANFTFLWGAGNIAIGFQMLTAFPLVAGFLILFAYRYLGIPARPPNQVASAAVEKR